MNRDYNNSPHLRIITLKYLLMVLVLLSVIYPGNVSAFRKTGTTAASFLLIPVGARLPAMGSAGIALSSSAEALAYNPALAWSENLGLSVAHADWFAGLRHQSLALTVPYNPDFVLGVHVLSFTGDSFEQTTLQQQEGTGVMVDYGDISAGVSGIARLTDRFTVGLTSKYIHQKLFHETASTFAFDIGTHLVTDLRGLTIGMAMTNLGGEMKLDGRDLYVEEETGTQLETTGWPLPLSFQTGIGWKLLGDNNSFWSNDYNSFLAAVDAIHLNEGATSLHVGIEYGYGDVIFLRSGHISGHDSKKWTYGAGVRLKLYSYIVQADYALAELEDLGGIQRVAISLQRRLKNL